MDCLENIEWNKVWNSVDIDMMQNTGFTTAIIFEDNNLFT